MKDILFVSDLKGWAFDITYQGIVKHLDADLYYTSDEPRITTEVIKQYKFVHFFNWLGAQKWAGMDNVSAGVCQHQFEIKWQDIAPKYLGKLKRVVAISRELEEKLKKFNSNITYIPNAVDHERFLPCPHEGAFTVGWLSQKTSGGFGEGKKTSEGRKRFDIKGYELLLTPIMERLKGKVKFKICSNDHSNAIPHSQIHNWYKDIDVLLCTSMYEGGPFSVLEAASSGKPIISTRVGLVPELIQDGEGGFLVDAPRSYDQLPRLVDEFVENIEMLQASPELCSLMGVINRRNVEESWSWEKITPMWKEFFK